MSRFNNVILKFGGIVSSFESSPLPVLGLWCLNSIINSFSLQKGIKGLSDKLSKYTSCPEALCSLLGHYFLMLVAALA